MSDFVFESSVCVCVQSELMILMDDRSVLDRRQSLFQRPHLVNSNLFVVHVPIGKAIPAEECSSHTNVVFVSIDNKRLAVGYR